MFVVFDDLIERGRVYQSLATQHCFDGFNAQGLGRAAERRALVNRRCRAAFQSSSDSFLMTITHKIHDIRDVVTHG